MTAPVDTSDPKQLGADTARRGGGVSAPFVSSLEYKVSVLRARAMTGAQKVEEGCEAFERECARLLEGVKSEMPGGCEEMLLMLVRDRLNAQFPLT